MAEVKKQIAAQDECAPDALEYFNAAMKMLCGLDVEELKFRATKTVDGNVIRWRFSNLILEHSADHPYYVLYRVEDSDDSNDDIKVLSRDQEDAMWGVIQHIVRDLFQRPERTYSRDEVISMVNNEIMMGPTIVSTSTIGPMKQSQYTPKERADMYRSAIKEISDEQVKFLKIELQNLVNMIANKEAIVSSTVFKVPGEDESFEITKKMMVMSWESLMKLISRKNEIISMLFQGKRISNEQYSKYIMSDDSLFIPEIE